MAFFLSASCETATSFGFTDFFLVDFSRLFRPILLALYTPSLCSETIVHIYGSTLFVKGFLSFGGLSLAGLPVDLFTLIRRTWT